MAALSNSLVNAVITLTCSAVGVQAVRLQQFGTDSQVDIPDLSDIKGEVTVDGFVIFSSIAALMDLTVHLNAASASARVFDSITALRRSSGEVTAIEQFDIALPSIGKRYTFRDLAVVNYTPAPSGGQTLKNMSYKLQCSTLQLQVSSL